MLPLQYKERKAYFMDFELKVTEDTLIPRPETEILVEALVEKLLDSKTFQTFQILDLGTGCGNIAISLTKRMASGKITASDISGKALSVAKENAFKYDCLDRIDFIQSDLFSGFDKSKYASYFDMIVSNPPYVSGADMETLPGEVRAEPKEALYGGEDGLDFYRRIIEESPYYLKKGGLVAMELGYDQASRVKEMLETRGFKNIELLRDYNAIERIALGKWIN